ncbi:cell division protein ZapA [Pelomonas sp. KK5]|uniref:cell division protein ZapA n=1 Tax=Pelomonas sp. KK5 TaxID=1855730 RepID=UPI00097BD6FE|nr:cell division protein ZapA [Pelomonas sp. KK5]
MKQMEVTIMGQSYLLGCPEGGEAALTRAVTQVDKEMCSIRDAGKIKARERIAVLAALNLAYQLAEGKTSAVPAANTAAAASQPELENLVRRLDEALGRDGQLL